MIELRDCPFCGSWTAPEISLVSDAEGMDEGDPNFHWASTHYQVVCNYLNGGCGASTTAAENDTPEKAAACWNRRVTDYAW